jgi:hypothetical protein
LTIILGSKLEDQDGNRVLGCPIHLNTSVDTGFGGLIASIGALKGSFLSVASATVIEMKGIRYVGVTSYDPSKFGKLIDFNPVDINNFSSRDLEWLVAQSEKRADIGIATFLGGGWE